MILHLNLPIKLKPSNFRSLGIGFGFGGWAVVIEWGVVGGKDVDVGLCVVVGLGLVVGGMLLVVGGCEVVVGGEGEVAFEVVVGRIVVVVGFIVVELGGTAVVVALFVGSRPVVGDVVELECGLGDLVVPSEEIKIKFQE